MGELNPVLLYLELDAQEHALRQERALIDARLALIEAQKGPLYNQLRAAASQAAQQPPAAPQAAKSRLEQLAEKVSHDDDHAERD